MDHLIERINADIEFEFEYFYRELKSGKYGADTANDQAIELLKHL